jgi:pSer/pThr/pTyr-binding forkhead associated (FHA) protein
VSDQVLSILKLCLVAVLYLFFLRVLWAVATEVRAPELVPGDGPRRTKKARPAKVAPAEGLVVLAPAEIAGRSFPLANELTIGRASGCHISLDDTFVSQLHARVFREDGVVHLEDLGSTNGTFLNDSQVSTAAIVRKGDRVRIGSTVMELRT